MQRVCVEPRLIQIPALRKLIAVGAYIANLKDHITFQSVLNVHVPLQHIRPAVVCVNSERIWVKARWRYRVGILHEKGRNGGGINRRVEQLSLVRMVLAKV